MAMLVITKGKSKETYTYTMVIWVYENNPEKKHCLTVEKGWTWPIEIDEIVSDLPKKNRFLHSTSQITLWLWLT